MQVVRHMIGVQGNLKVLRRQHRVQMHGIGLRRLHAGLPRMHGNVQRRDHHGALRLLLWLSGNVSRSDSTDRRGWSTRALRRRITHRFARRQRPVLPRGHIADTQVREPALLDARLAARQVGGDAEERERDARQCSGRSSRSRRRCCWSRVDARRIEVGTQCVSSHGVLLSSSVPSERHLVSVVRCGVEQRGGIGLGGGRQGEGGRHGQVLQARAVRAVAIRRGGRSEVGALCCTRCSGALRVCFQLSQSRTDAVRAGRQAFARLERLNCRRIHMRTDRHGGGGLACAG